MDVMAEPPMTADPDMTPNPDGSWPPALFVWTLDQQEQKYEKLLEEQRSRINQEVHKLKLARVLAEEKLEREKLLAGRRPALEAVDVANIAEDNANSPEINKALPENKMALPEWITQFPNNELGPAQESSQASKALRDENASIKEQNDRLTKALEVLESLNMDENSDDDDLEDNDRYDGWAKRCKQYLGEKRAAEKELRDLKDEHADVHRENERMAETIRQMEEELGRKSRVGSKRLVPNKRQSNGT